MKFIKSEFSRFVFCGGVNTCIGYVFYLLLLLFLPYLIAYSVAYTFGTFFSYFLNSTFVFKQKLEMSKAAKYALAYLHQYLVGAGLLFVLVHFLKMNKLLAPVLVMALTTPATYFLSRRIVKPKT